MTRLHPDEKLQRKRETWLRRTAEALQTDEVSARRLLRTTRQQSARLNPLVADPAATLQAMKALGWQGEVVAWAEHGYTIEAGLEALRDSQLAAGGALLIQNAASWLPVLALDPQPGNRILDVCAAPGGKTTHIAALSANRAHITANDNSRARLMKLQAMCGRMKADVEQFSLFDARYLARKLTDEQFDRILVDAPCSGEGMMHFDNDKDFDTWSLAHIKRLQQLQKRILNQAWQLLKPGGTLVYSTCTMAPEENEAVIDYALRALEAVRIEAVPFRLPNRVPVVMAWNGRAYRHDLQNCIRLKPSSITEAFFVCKLHKSFQG